MELIIIGLLSYLFCQRNNTLAIKNKIMQSFKGYFLRYYDLKLYRRDANMEILSEAEALQQAKDYENHFFAKLDYFAIDTQQIFFTPHKSDSEHQARGYFRSPDMEIIQISYKTDESAATITFVDKDNEVRSEALYDGVKLYKTVQ